MVSLTLIEIMHKREVLGQPGQLHHVLLSLICFRLCSEETDDAVTLERFNYDCQPRRLGTRQQLDARVKIIFRDWIP